MVRLVFIDWRKVLYFEGFGWVNFYVFNICIFSDVDFLFWKGW